MPTSTVPLSSIIPTAPSTTQAPTTSVVTYAGGASNGVATVAPPEVLLPSITAAVTKACQSIPAGRTAALVAVADGKGANVAVVQKLGDHVTVMGWLGKSWGQPVEGGASVMASW
jgi:hypothetical protein